MLWVTITTVTSWASRRSSPRCGGWRWGRAPSRARPSAARRAVRRAPGRCRGAAAGHPRARRRAASSRFAPRSTGRPRRATLDERRPCRGTGAPSLSPARTLSRMLIAGNGFGFWNTMPMRRGSRWGRSRAVDVLAVEQTVRPARRRHQLVHAVEDAEEGGLAAARRPDQRGDPFRFHLDLDAIEHLVDAEPRALSHWLRVADRGGRCG